MESLVISEKLVEFINSLPLSCNNIYKAIECIKDNITPLMQECEVARFSHIIHLNADFDFFLPYDDECVLYENGAYTDEAHIIKFEDANHGHVEYCFFPSEGKKFSQKEITILDFVARSLFVYVGRTRVRGILIKIPEIDIQTGLHNITGVRKYSEEFSSSKNTISEYSCAILNLKGFSYTNQIIGQKAGDLFIKAFAEYVKKLMPQDCFAARLDGDNFYFVVRNECLESFIAELATLTIDVNLGDLTKKIPVKFRVGIYNMQEGDNISDCIPKARAALSLARQSLEQDIVVFKSVFMEELNKQKFVDENFHDALKNREFTVYYQPKVDNRNKSIYGCEALVRWIKNGKIISPGEFIPVLENNGNICNLDFYVLECVCRDLVNWIKKGIEPVRTSVNFSRLHLHNRHISSDILAIIDRYGVDHKYIEIELTESSGYGDFNAFAQFITDMKSHDIAISIDDFGTGYSSLNLLKNIDADIVKLDKSFIDKVDNMNRADDVIISAIINMAHELEMSVITEGVETKQQADYLNERNCYHIQGYLFDKPLEHDVFEKRLINKVYANY